MGLDFDFANHVRERNAALMSMDRAVLVAFFRKHGSAIPKDEEVFWAGVHKARTAVPALPIEARRESKHWLEAHGYRSEDDGDL